MSQQDFFSWAQRREGEEITEEVEREPRQAPRGTGKGRLFLSELPPELGHCLKEVQELHGELQERLGSVDLVLTDNRRRMISAKRRRGGFRLRLHHMFIGCGEEILDAVALLARGGAGSEAARELLKAFIDAHREEISSEVDPQALTTQGEHHDLQALLDRWKDRLGPETLKEVKITWGRYGRGQRTIRFGSYEFGRRLIRIHPALDQEWVPEAFVEFIVYHELLHALFPPKKGSGRRIVHTREFRQMEEKFPGFEEVMAWEARNLYRFLER